MRAPTLFTGLCRLQRARVLTGLAALSSPSTFLDADKFAAAKAAATSQKFPHQLPIEDFLERGGLLGDAEIMDTPIIDVRAPCEYAKGHIPGAVNVPLFDDDERAEVGTLYKRNGHDSAVRRGLQIIERKGWDTLLDAAPALREGDDVLVYCFRGGMRSGGMAWLLSQAPLRVHTLQGGYKRFRNWAIDSWSLDRPLVVVGGPTGSGKTDVLHALSQDLKQQVIDLEGEANHRGSIFGALGRAPQPTNEHYENLLALHWRRFSQSSPVFVEDESHAVGKCGVPPGLWARMREEQAMVLRL